MHVILDRCPRYHGVRPAAGEFAPIVNAVTDASIATGMVIGIAPV